MARRLYRAIPGQSDLPRNADDFKSYLAWTADLLEAGREPFKAVIDRQLDGFAPASLCVLYTLTRAPTDLFMKWQGY